MDAGRRSQAMLRPWIYATAGHHGLPPGKGRRVDETFDAQDREAALDFAAAVAKLFLPKGADDLRPVLGMDAGQSARLSWLLSGLCTLSDWIGSNQEHFPCREEPMHLADYWHEHALPQARRAVAATGVLPAAPAPHAGFHDLFPAIPTPRPLQAFAATTPLPDGPCLWIFEDLTGSGKTEAALTMAQRLMATGRAGGIYMALPTMATANAMYDRVKEAYRRLFDASARPSLVLAHGSRDLHDGFAATIAPDAAANGQSPIPSDDRGEATCAAWLADNRKKSLLASVGVGTIDQALLAGIRARHQTLRLFGLSRSILLADEVHANDPYVHELLRGFLRMHAALGGSAILLSATLPRKMRQELVASFAEGLGMETEEVRQTAYPLATCIGRAGIAEHPLPVHAQGGGFVGVELVHDEEAMIQAVLTAVRAGACCAWVRNTVDDAVAAYQRLATELPAESLTLFHARFCLADRLAIERRVLDRFGKGSTPESRTGQVVVSTQVFEMSIDADTDLLLTDLAPVDSLVQRAGRCHRHHGRPRPAGYERPRCLLLCPPPEDAADAHWYERLFPSGQYVYPHHGRLWATARLMADAGGFDLARPGEARRLIEAVYDDERPWTIPEALDDRDCEAEGKARASGSVGSFNVLQPDLGYGGEDDGWRDDEQAPTRLAEPTTVFRLAKFVDGRLIPWADDPNPHRAWRLSEISVRSSRLAQAGPFDAALATAVEEAKAAMPDGGTYAEVLPLWGENEGVWEGRGKNRQQNFIINYSSMMGLILASA